MAQNRKKPVVVDAVQLPITAAPAWLADAMDAEDAWLYTNGTADIRTLEGVMHADAGDWIIRGIKGEIYPCKPDVFAATYEPA
jgi:hypothetical protein